MTDAPLSPKCAGCREPSGTCFPDPCKLYEARFAIGANGPPLDKPDPYGAITAHLDELLIETRNWADGVPATTQAQVDEIDRLIGDLRDGADAAEAQRLIEKRPLDEQIAAIQERYNVYLAPPKNKVPGRVPIALDVLKNAKAPFLLEREQERLAAAEKAREEAEAAQRAAMEAMRATQADDLAAREEAEALVRAADVAATVAKRADKAATTGTGLRSHWSPTLTDGVAAARYYWGAEREKCEAFFSTLARADVLAGKRTIPGFSINEERKAI